jgi:HK97 family phage major capsid protein
MPTSVELRQQRARVVESIRAIVDSAEAENRNLSGEEREQFDRHEAEFRDLGERITRVEAQEQREAELSERINGAGGQAVDTAETRGAQRRSAFLQFVRRGAGSLAPEQRALVENSDGQILVPEDLETEIYRELPAITVMRGLAGTRATQRDRVRRRSLDEVSVGWGKLETDEQTLTDSMPGTPAEAYSYVEDQYGLAKIGEDEMDDTDVNLEAFVRDSFTIALGESEDTGFTVGAGHSSHEPVGWTTDIYNASTNKTGIHTVAGASTDYAQEADVDWAIIDDLQKLIYAVPAQYRKGGAFIMASGTELFISTRRNANGDRLWQPSTQAGRPNTFLGYDIYNQEDVAAIAASKVIAGFGSWKSGYRILDRQGMTVQRLVELYAEDGEIGFKVRRRVGGDVVRPDALRLLQTKAS